VRPAERIGKGRGDDRGVSGMAEKIYSAIDANKLAAKPFLTPFYSLNLAKT